MRARNPDWLPWSCIDDRVEAGCDAIMMAVNLDRVAYGRGAIMMARPPQFTPQLRKVQVTSRWG